MGGVAARAADCRPAEREGALGLLRADAERRQQGWYGGPVLVDSLLHDEDVDAAWQAATRTGAHDRQWLTVADRARAIRPADALGVCLRLAEPLTKQTGNTVHEQLVGLLPTRWGWRTRMRPPRCFGCPGARCTCWSDGGGWVKGRYRISCRAASAASCGH